MKQLKLSNGVLMDQAGLGVWQMNNEEAESAVKNALQAGVRLIDTAANYQNEAAVGSGIQESGVAREDLFIVTKVRNSNQGYEETFQAFNDSLEKLGLDYVDMYLIHWPVAKTFKDTWRAMEEIYASKKARAIGVCNFHQHHMEDLLKDAKIKPMVNQIELHPLLNQTELVEYCEQKDIKVMAYSPLGNGKLLTNEALGKIAEKYQKTTAQIILRWAIERGVIVIPKSIHLERIKENMAIFDFSLAQVDMETINQMNQDFRFGTDPEHFEEIFAKK